MVQPACKPHFKNKRDSGEKKEKTIDISICESAALCPYWDLGLRSGEKFDDSKNILVITGGNNTSGGLGRGDREPSSTRKKWPGMERLK